MILITRSQDGIFAFDKEEGAFWSSGYNINMKDNIGSGMAFSAGFLHYFLNKKPINEALEFGNAAGALNATKRGATAYFNKDDVLKFMKATSKNKLLV